LILNKFYLTLSTIFSISISKRLQGAKADLFENQKLPSTERGDRKVKSSRGRKAMVFRKNKVTWSRFTIV